MSPRQKNKQVEITNDPRWAAIIARDPVADGQFFYSVRTTGVYCRPACGARTPRPENVAFHATADAAENAGFRPCRRCKPNQPSLKSTHAKRVAEVCRLITSTDKVPSMEQLGRHVGLSVSHLHRLFKASTGLTPRSYAIALRTERVRSALTTSDTVTSAIYAAGYNSNGRFYADSSKVLGMTPTRFRSGGVATEICFAVAEIALGALLVAASARGICAIFLGDDPKKLIRDLQDRFANASLIAGDAEFEKRVAHVVAFVEAPRLGLDLPLDIQGTAFQQRVWCALQAIPAGTTVSYAELASRIGAPRAVRAVAGACAANALAVAIPCHRVVRSDGSLSGYRWGLDRKRALLEREAKG